MNRFLTSYEGTPPWDIGRPQAAIAELEIRGLVRSPVIDVGCGTGENALYFASQGHEVLGVDMVGKAIDKARQKARERGIEAAFEVGDALCLEQLGRTFRTAIDSGVFHVFDDAERARYVESLARALEPGGTYFMLVFSDREPADWGGPRRIRREEIELAFTRGWRVLSIEPARVQTNFHAEGGYGWLAAVERASPE